uniref:FKBP prolyl isomerase 14 n=1 Tax=Oncorhynchus mykiss TaxID=8022 RepID=A0A8K9Y823_ONCMY
TTEMLLLYFCQFFSLVKIEVLHKPFACFQKSKYGDILLVHFEGFLESNGTMFHSRDKKPGLKNMCPGGRRELISPPSSGLWQRGKRTLIFDIEIMEIRNGPRSHESFQEMDRNDDWRLSKPDVGIRGLYTRQGLVDPPTWLPYTRHEAMVQDLFISSREFTYKHNEL